MNKDEFWNETLVLAKRSGFHIDLNGNIHTMLIDKHHINEEIESLVSLTIKLTEIKQSEKIIHLISEISKGTTNIHVEYALNRIIEEIEERLYDE